MNKIPGDPHFDTTIAENPNTPKTVLLIEDDLLWATTTQEIIRDMGLKVIVASDPEQALAALEEHSVNVNAIVLDVLIRPENAFSSKEEQAGMHTALALFRLLRKKYPNIPIIVFSSVLDGKVYEWFQKSNIRFVHKPDLDELVGVLKKTIGGTKQLGRPRILILHGHDNKTKSELVSFLQNDLHLPPPVVLHERPSLGRTVIEKLEDGAKTVDVVFVLLTPDDRGKKVATSNEEKRRARQNVIFEMGFFAGKLGSSRIILLYKGKLDLPSDIAGITYIDISLGVNAARETIRRELATWL